MSKTPIIIVTNGNERASKSDMIDENQFTVDFIRAPINFEIFAAEVKKCLLLTNATHVLVINDQNIINRRFMSYVKFASNRINFVDFYQIGGGKISLSLYRNLIHNIRTVIVIKLVLRLPIAVLKFLRIIFNYLPLSSSLKNLVISSLLRNYENINRFDSDNLYLSHVVNWNNIRPPLKAFFVSQVWIEALTHLHRKPLLTFERANIALARSGNLISTSKLFLY
jgi:hypothetical protein